MAHTNEKARLLTEPHDGHEPEVTCPGCPHDEAIADAAYKAFWREHETGNTERDRGGYYGRGFRDGYAQALLDLRSSPEKEV